MPTFSQGRLFAIRLLTAWAMLLSPIAALHAAEPAVPADYLTSQSVAAISLRPQQLLSYPHLELLPIEVAQAAGEKYLGMDPKKISHAFAIGEPPLGAIPFYAVVLQADEPWDLKRLAPELTQHTQPGEVAGQACLVSQHPALPCLAVLEGKTLVAASRGMLEKILKSGRPESVGVLAELVKQRTGGDDLYAAVDLEALRPLIQLGLMGARQETPPEYQRFLDMPTLLQSVELTVNVDAKRNSSLVATASSQQDAQQLETMYDDLIATFRDQAIADMGPQIARFQSSDDPVERAFGDYLERISQSDISGYRPTRSGNQFVLFDLDLLGGNPAVGVAGVGILVALLLPAVQAAREAARRTQSTNNLKLQMLGLFNYESVYGYFPPHAIYNDAGEPLLSWRVTILPYIEEQALYEQFHLDEPWDSEHNRALIPLMPEIYLDPTSSLDRAEGKTHYLGVVGAEHFFIGKSQGQRIAQITDGTSNSIAIVQVNDEQAQTWTKPADFKPDRNDPVGELGGLHPGIFNAGYADGSVQAIQMEIDPTVFWSLLTINGGEVVGGHGF